MEILYSTFAYVSNCLCCFSNSLRQHCLLCNSFIIVNVVVVISLHYYTFAIFICVYCPCYVIINYYFNWLSTETHLSSEVSLAMLALLSNNSRYLTLQAMQNVLYIWLSLSFCLTVIIFVLFLSSHHLLLFFFDIVSSAPHLVAMAIADILHNKSPSTYSHSSGIFSKIIFFASSLSSLRFP